MSTKKDEKSALCLLPERIEELLGGHSLKDYAAKTGVPHHLLRDWRRGVVPRLSEFRRFCELSQTSPLWLALGIGQRSLHVSLSDPDTTKRLKFVQGDHKISDLVRKTGLVRTTLNSYLSGVSEPRLDKLIVVAEAMDCSFAWLLTGQGPRTPFEGERDAPREATDHLSPTLPPGAVRVVPATGAQVRKLPFLGRIEAGFSALAIQEAELREFSKWMCPRGDAFALRVHGDSMVDAGIRSGDIVILRAAVSAEDGEVVAATIGEESMLKLLRHDADGWWLIAANKMMTERRPLDGAIIHGVVHTVIRQVGSTPIRVPELVDPVQ